MTELSQEARVEYLRSTADHLSMTRLLIYISRQRIKKRRFSLRVQVLIADIEIACKFISHWMQAMAARK